MEYGPDLLAHYKQPMNHGPLPGATHEGAVGNPLCGDDLSVRLRVVDGVVEEARFEGVGCAISIASASLQTEDWKGKRLADVLARGPSDAIELMGMHIAPGRIECANLVLRAAQVAQPQPS